MVKVTSGFLLAAFLLITVFAVPVSAFDTLTINGTSGDNIIIYGIGSDPTNGSIMVDGSGPIHFFSFTHLLIDALEGNDLITINNPNLPTDLTDITVNGSSGNDVINLLNAGAGLSGPVTLNGGDGDDTFNVSPSNSAVVNIDGGNGEDTLVVDAKGTPAWDTGLAVIFSAGSGFKPVNYANVENVTIVNSTADLSITKVAGSSTVNAGDTIGYTITLNNTGGDAYNVEVTDPLPPGVLWTTTSGTISGGTLTDTIGTLAHGATAVIHVSGPTTAANAGTLSNTATVTSTNNNPLTLSSTASITVNAPDLSNVKTSDQSIINVGDTAAYTITVKNTGLGAAYNVTVDDPLPAEVNWTTSTPGASISAGKLTDTIGTLAAGGSVVIHVSGPTTTAGTLDNTATVTSTNNNPSTLSSTASITVNAPDLSNVKISDQSIINVGDTAAYTITVKNTGLGAAYNVTVDDPLPAEVNWTTSTPGASISAGKLTDTIGTLAHGGSVVIHVSGPTTTAGTLDNTATVTSTNNNPLTLSSTASITVQAPNIIDSKTVKLETDADGNGVPSPGDTLKYTATITNDGNGSAFGVGFSDTPDANTTLITGSVKTTLGTVSKGNSPGNKWVEVSLGTIPGHGTATVTFEVIINDPLWEHYIANQAIVNGTNFSSVKSDDPGTPQLGDPTIISIQSSPPVHGPGLSQWGIVVLTVLLSGAMVWIIRRRQIGSGTH